MHEMSIAMGIIEIVEEYARANEAICVKIVVVDLDEYSDTIPDAVGFCYKSA